MPKCWCFKQEPHDDATPSKIRPSPPGPPPLRGLRDQPAPGGPAFFRVPRGVALNTGSQCPAIRTAIGTSIRAAIGTSSRAAIGTAIGSEDPGSAPRTGDPDADAQLRADATHPDTQLQPTHP